MISLAKLKKMAAEALRHLHDQKDVTEAEVFAAGNSSRICRLNYTSHIPCNGVEEPKSTESYGLGIRALFSTPEGAKVGFGSEPSDLTPEGVQRSLEKARRGAVSDPEFLSLPRPTGERRALRKYHDPQLLRITDKDFVRLGWQLIHGALRTFRQSEHLIARAGSEEGLSSLGLIVGGDVTVLHERIAIASSAMPRVQADESTLLLSSVTAWIERCAAKGSGWSMATSLAHSPDAAATEAAGTAIAAIDGQRIPGGEYTVILGPQPVADLMNNILLPSLTTAAFYAESSPFLGKFGQTVASPLLTLYDDGATPGLVGSKGITCEGLPTGRTMLIREGALVGLLSNFYETHRLLQDERGREKLGVNPSDHPSAFTPRNGFRFKDTSGRHFDTPPAIAPTNVIVEGEDPLPLQQLLRRVGTGVYIGRIWYTYPINGLRSGDFSCTVTGDSFTITDGHLHAPIKPNTLRLSCNIHHLLTHIIGMAAERKGTLLWAADEVVYAPEIAIAGVKLEEIGEYP